MVDSKIAHPQVTAAARAGGTMEDSEAGSDADEEKDVEEVEAVEGPHAPLEEGLQDQEAESDAAAVESTECIQL